tara:strand:- start:468 stop:2867 length:2400 start_codon:yes stop_codon:yes gene_type:complete
MALTQISTQGIKDGTITGSDLATNIDLVDNQKLRLGTGNDLEIYHTGAASLIDNKNANNFFIRNLASNIYYDALTHNLRNSAGTEVMAVFTTNGSVELYHDNSKKFETTSAGATVTGTLTATSFSGDGSNLTGIDSDVVNDTSPQLGGPLNTNGQIIKWPDSTGTTVNRAVFGAGDDLMIYHNGSNSVIREQGTGDLNIQTTGGNVQVFTNTTETSAKFISDGAVELYHNGSKRFETSSDGATFSGSALFPDNQRIKVGGDASTPDLQIWHDGSHTRMQHQGTGQFIIYGNDNDQVKLMKGSSEEGIILNNNGNVELYHNNSKKFETTSTGVSVTGGITADGTSEFTANVKLDGGTAGRDITFLRDSNKLRFQDNTVLSFGDSDDLLVFHNGTIMRFVHQLAGSNIEFQSDNYVFRDKDNSDLMIRALHDGAVELYYDNAKKFETYANGCTVTGNLNAGNVDLADNAKARFGTSNDLEIYHDGTDNIFQSNGLKNFIFRPKDTDVGLKIIGDGAVELYHNNSKKLHTFDSGVVISGDAQWMDGDDAQFGSSADLKIFHNGTNSYVRNSTGQLLVGGSGGNLVLEALGDVRTVTWEGESMIEAKRNGAVELYHNNSKKLETTSSGIDVTGAITVNGSALTGGKVLQVVSVVKTDTASNSTGSQQTWEYNNSSLRVQITGSSTNNKFLFIGQVTTGGEISTHIGLRDGETSSNVTGMMASNDGNTRSSTSGHDHGDSHSASTVPIIGLISVPDTNQHTYYYQFSHTSGGTITLYLNRGSNTGNNAERGRYISSLTVMEIAG